MKKLKIISLIILFVLLTNYAFPFRVLLGMVFSNPKYHVDYFTYSTAGGTYQAEQVPLKGPTFDDLVDKSFENYKQLNPTSGDTVLHRTFKKNILEFWNWGLFFTDERYALPYLESPAIKKD